MLSDHERNQAIKEGARNAADAAYFNERPHLADDNGIRVFDAGFDRGWDAACAERDARIAELERLRSEDHSHALDLAAEIERMTKQLEEARKDAMHEAALICDHLDAEVDKYPAACADAIRAAIKEQT